MARIIEAFKQFLDNNGDPLSGGKLYFYITGTGTAKDTYSDSALTTPNTNPVVLDAYGRATDGIFGAGSYKCVSKTSAGVQIEEFDPIGEITSYGPFTAWVAAYTYSARDIVKGSDGNYYISLAGSNVGNDPISSAAYWSQINILYYYNSNQTYADGDMVRDASGEVFVSLSGSNLNHNPVTSPTYWTAVTLRTYSAAATYPAGEVIKDSSGNLWRAIQSTTGNTPSTDDGTYWEPATVLSRQKLEYTGNDTLTKAQLKQYPVVSNYGAVTSAEVTLPVCTSGIGFVVMVEEAYTLKITPVGTDVFRYLTDTSSAAESIYSSTVGTCCTVNGTDGGEWIISDLLGALTYA